MNLTANVVPVGQELVHPGPEAQHAQQEAGEAGEDCHVQVVQATDLKMDGKCE